MKFSNTVQEKDDLSIQVTA